MPAPNPSVSAEVRTWTDAEVRRVAVYGYRGTKIKEYAQRELRRRVREARRP